MSKRIATVTIVLALVGSGAALAAVSSKGTTVDLHKTNRGKVLATSTGRTLYLYTGDSKNKSNCTGGCAASWPPLMTKGKPVAGMGVNKALLGTAKRGSKLQVSYNGHPLYTFVGDSSAGQANGEGQGGFFVVKANGKKG